MPHAVNIVKAIYNNKYAIEMLKKDLGYEVKTYLAHYEEEIASFSSDNYNNASVFFESAVVNLDTMEISND